MSNFCSLDIIRISFGICIWRNLKVKFGHDSGASEESFTNNVEVVFENISP